MLFSVQSFQGCALLRWIKNDDNMKKGLIFCAALTLALAQGCMMDGCYDMEIMDGVVAEGRPEMEDTGRYDEIVENHFISVADEPVSTFSVDADGASYSFVKRCVRDGYYINRGIARIEEFINYFPYDYADPTDGNKVALNSEVFDCPWDTSHYIMRLGMKGQSLKPSEYPQANYVFLIDTSGSMDSEDKLGLLKSSLKALVDVLDDEDRISIITYSGTVKKLLESTPVSESGKIKKAIGKLTASGSTAGGAAMEMAYKECLNNYIKGGNNRVIMGTDGDFNVGVTSTDALLEMVQDYAKEGIYLTVCGFGWGNLNDSMMETVSNKGNGTYEYIASQADMMKVFVNENSKFVSVANDCKVQVTFNPETVARYRLIGYENRVMENEDFENDEKDAAEIGAGQTVTALYEIVPAEGFFIGCSCADFDFRYKKSLDDSSVLLQEKVEVGAAESASPDFSFACAVAAYGLVFRDSAYKGSADLDLVRNLASIGAEEFDPYGYRSDFISLVDVTEAYIAKFYKKQE